jgi:hypothetical protein
MDTQAANAIKRAFREWSAGFPPESDYQIAVFIDYALPTDINAEQARHLLRTWMCATDPEADLDAPPDHLLTFRPAP